MAIPQHFITNNAKIKKRIITKKITPGNSGSERFIDFYVTSVLN